MKTGVLERAGDIFATIPIDDSHQLFGTFNTKFTVWIIWITPRRRMALRLKRAAYIFIYAGAAKRVTDMGRHCWLSHGGRPYNI